jgi:hypothetical protein
MQNTGNNLTHFARWKMKFGMGAHRHQKELTLWMREREKQKQSNLRTSKTMERKNIKKEKWKSFLFYFILMPVLLY